MARIARDNHKGLALFLALLLCGVVSAVHKELEVKDGHDPIAGSVRDAALVPAQTSGLRFGIWWNENISALFHGAILARENSHLKGQVMHLESENRRLEEAQIENDRLRDLLNFEHKSSLPLLPAEVSALKPNNQQDTALLNKGSADGVRVHSVALAASGAVVGQVLDVSLHSCTVLLVTDGDSSVGAQVQIGKKMGPIGICQGQGAGLLRVLYLPSATPITRGDLVTTSGVGGIYPANLPVGVVTSVSVDPTMSLQTATVQPSADLNHLDEALIVR